MQGLIKLGQAAGVMPSNEISVHYPSTNNQGCCKSRPFDDQSSVLRPRFINSRLNSVQNNSDLLLNSFLNKVLMS